MECNKIMENLEAKMRASGWGETISVANPPGGPIRERAPQRKVLRGDVYPDLFGEPFTSMATDSGALVVFALD